LTSPFGFVFRAELVLRATICQACADTDASERSGPRRKSEWQRLCPPHYQRDLPPGILAQSWVGDVLGWQYKPQGLLVIGETGAGKTWVMWRLLRRLLEERRSVVVLDAMTYRSGLSKAAREGETEDYVRRLARADVLYWDDFGQTHLSAAASEMLLHVIEQRTSHERPMLVTSQYRGTALELQFERPEMGAAVRRRVNEFCRIVKTCREPMD
jgi:DNA replication protein DnaC